MLHTRFLRLRSFGGGLDRDRSHALNRARLPVKDAESECIHEIVIRSGPKRSHLEWLAHLEGEIVKLIFNTATSISTLFSPFHHLGIQTLRLRTCNSSYRSASPASTNPSNVMMLSSLVRFPLIFISGIFVPIATLQGSARVAVYCSPITYLVDGFDRALLGSATIPLLLDWAALICFSVVFVLLARTFHRRNLMKGL